jgi:hypothetical protein
LIGLRDVFDLFVNEGIDHQLASGFYRGLVVESHQQNTQRNGHSGQQKGRVVVRHAGLVVVLHKDRMAGLRALVFLHDGLPGAHAEKEDDARHRQDQHAEEGNDKNRNTHRLCGFRLTIHRA